MKQYLTVFLLAFGLMFVIGSAKLQAQNSYSGKIVDLGLYMGMNNLGEDGAAQAAAPQGYPMGLVTKSGDLYVLLPDFYDTAPYRKAKQHAGTSVKVTGIVMKKGGVQSLRIWKVEATGQANEASAK